MDHKGAAPFIAQRLKDLKTELELQAQSFVGYPCNAAFDYSELFPFLHYSINNVGDPFAGSTYRLNTHPIEMEVLRFFADLTHAPKDNFWGYVTNGGTEGNLYGLFLARETLPDAITYYSEDAHYSVSKNLRLLNMKNIMIRTQENGEMDYDDLSETLRLHRDSPPIIFITIGTTMTGAVDNMDKINTILRHFAIPRYYIHADTALSGMILPFVDDPQPFDFSSGIDSLSISGHKMIGAPMPCGVALAKKKNVDRIARSVEYVGALDTTLTGSRNGITPLMLWYAIQKHGTAGFRKMALRCLENADYATRMFRNNGVKAWRNKNSITVVFPKPSKTVLERWQIAVYGQRAHIITMPHVSRPQLQKLLQDMLAHPAAE